MNVMCLHGHNNNNNNNMYFDENEKGCCLKSTDSKYIYTFSI